MCTKSLNYLLNFAKIQIETNKIKKERYFVRQDNTTPATTYEGENTLMMLQTARYKSILNPKVTILLKYR